ncbi:phosphatidate cytidylyltransferase [Stakelama sp. CBK3Z-3]|uniref:Phosphatidate cytidylyltransferase n=1 Tax=Stakelama flava TaxID=2860338 RepID=A0ABS6XL36_9SPHN|nr:phosphatidate cytidylyltransferase [Stakelama flava]
MTDAPKPKSDLGPRAIVGAILIALAAVALWSGGFLFWLVLVIAALLMLSEWSDLAKMPAKDKRLAQFTLSVPLAIMCPLASGASFFALGLLAGSAFFVVIVTRKPRLAAGLIYVGLPVLALLAIRAQDRGLLLAFWTMALVWACDIGAYAAGRSFGGPKLAPAISPNKTWSGLIGGMAAATLFAALLTHWGLSPYMVAITPLLAIAAQIGDLYESWLKRRAGVKDSGTMLPGHGGFLDRLDGLVPVAPLAALVILSHQVLA